MGTIHFLPMDIEISVSSDKTVLEAAFLAGISRETPCGGHGKCGKCLVEIAGRKVLACQTKVENGMIVKMPEDEQKIHILSESSLSNSVEQHQKGKGFVAAVDIGTTTIVCYFLEIESGRCVEQISMRNPQFPYGLDVVSRLQYAAKGKEKQLTGAVQEGITRLLSKGCERQGILTNQIRRISVVGNPCMMQFFLGVPVDNLREPPFIPRITHTKSIQARNYLKIKGNAELLILPSISGYVGSDTLACILATHMEEKEGYTLLIDIGTNGEMALGNKNGLCVCSTAAGPALEGADITWGMTGSTGAIDHVWMEEGNIKYSVLGNQEAEGICGSGLIDAVAVFLEKGILNRRGKIVKNYQVLNSERVVYLNEKIYLTQHDIRAVQMAKGAIAAGIQLLMKNFNIEEEDITEVFFAGAFGSFIKSTSAARIGLFSETLLSKVVTVGNAAGVGSQMVARSKQKFFQADFLLKKITALELASIPEFQRIFAQHMYFRESE